VDLTVARMLFLWQLHLMKFNKIITLGLAVIVAVLSTSCGTLPELEKDLGPTSSEGTIPWNRRLPGEGTAALGGLGGR